jgi:C4-type Zn-finger protein
MAEAKAPPLDMKAKYVCPACQAPELTLITYRDDYTGSAANMTALCGKCGTLRRYRAKTLEKAS